MPCSQPAFHRFPLGTLYGGHGVRPHISLTSMASWHDPMLLLALPPSLCRKPSLSAKPKPLYKRQQALLQPVTLAFIPYKPYMPAVITHFQRYGRPQFFLAR